MNLPYRILKKHVWTTRAWTLQEYVLANQPTFVYGRWLAELDSAAIDVGPIMHEDDGMSQLLLIRSAYVNVMKHLHVASSHTPDDTLRDDTHIDREHELLDENLVTALELSIRAIIQRKATNLNDKVYGLYQMLSNIGLKLPEPNYELSPNEVFEHFTVAIMRGTRSLSVLSLFPSMVGLETGPSWVLRMTERPGRSAYFDATRFWRSARRPFHPDYDLQHVPGRLTLEGLSLGPIFIPYSEVCATQRLTHNRSMQWSSLLLRIKVRRKGPLSKDQREFVTSTLGAVVAVLTTLGLKPDRNTKLFRETIVTVLARNRAVLASSFGSTDPLETHIWCLAVEMWRVCSHKFLHDAFLNYRMWLFSMRLLILPDGRLGLVHGNARTQDTMALLHGASTPLVLRTVGTDYRFVGMALVENLQEEFPSTAESSHRSNVRQIVLV